MTIIKQYNENTTQWEPIVVGRTGNTGPGVANGGITDAVLVKSSNTDFDTEWTNDPTFNSLSIGITTQQTNTVTTAATNAETISTWSTNDYISSKAIITAVSNGESQISELLITYNSSNAFATEYGVLTTDTVLFTVDCSLVGNDMVIQVSSSSADTTEYKIHENLFSV